MEREPWLTTILWSIFAFFVMLGSTIDHRLNAKKLRKKRTQKIQGSL